MVTIKRFHLFNTCDLSLVSDMIHIKSRMEIREAMIHLDDFANRPLAEEVKQLFESRDCAHRPSTTRKGS